jgi:hypothetical protein
VLKEQHITALLLRALLDNSAHASCLLGSSSRHAFAAQVLDVDRGIHLVKPVNVLHHVGYSAGLCR